jgi:hypothetical protein
MPTRPAARRIAAEQAYQRCMQVPPAPAPVDMRKRECEDLAGRVSRLDAAARASQSGQMEDLYQSRSITSQMKPMDFFVWQGRSRERRREFWQHAASLCRGARAASR